MTIRAAWMGGGAGRWLRAWGLGIVILVVCFGPSGSTGRAGEDGLTAKVTIRWTAFSGSLPPLAGPEGRAVTDVVHTFLRRWIGGDLPGMYDLTSCRVHEKFTLAQFEDCYIVWPPKSDPAERFRTWWVLRPESVTSIRAYDASRLFGRGGVALAGMTASSQYTPF